MPAGGAADGTLSIEFLRSLHSVPSSSPRRAPRSLTKQLLPTCEAALTGLSLLGEHRPDGIPAVFRHTSAMKQSREPNLLTGPSKLLVPEHAHLSRVSYLLQPSIGAR